MRNVVLLGATGLIGSLCLQRLLTQDGINRVTALVRRPLPFSHEKLTQSVQSTEDMLRDQALFDAHDVVSCLGTTMKTAGSKEAFYAVDHDLVVAFAQRARDAGAQRFLMVSAVNADPDSRNFYSRTKGEAEASVMALGLPMLGMFQPSLLLGHRSERRLAEDVGQAMSRLAVPLMRRMKSRYTPIQAQTVADAMVSTLLRGPDTGIHRYHYTEMLALAAQRLQPALALN